jgi:cation transport regulator ChaC
MAEPLIAYFGFGSLVNRATHRTQIVDAFPARLIGWRRHWRPRPDMPGFPAALLTIRPEAGAGCDGLIVIDRLGNLAAVDAREARYERVELSRLAFDLKADLCGVSSLFAYVAQEHLPEHREPPAILRSYLDAVMQGFAAEHGDAGLVRFVAETDGFNLPVREDRDAPIYPRAVVVTPAERQRFDELVPPRRGI